MGKKKYGSNLLNDMKVVQSKVWVHKFIDFESYFYELDFNSQVWLATFTDEYYNGWFGRNDKYLPSGIMASDEVIKKEYEKIIKDEQQYEQFKEELADFNRTRRSRFPAYIENTYKRYMEIHYMGKKYEELKKEYSQDLISPKLKIIQAKEIKTLKSEIKRQIDLYNQYTGNNHKYPFSHDGYKQPESLPTVYKTLGPLDYIRFKIVNTYNTAQNSSTVKEDFISYDYSEENNIVNSNSFQKRLNEDDMDFSDLLTNLEPHVDSYSEDLPYDDQLATEFEQFKDQGKLDIFVLKLFNKAYEEFSDIYRKEPFSKNLVTTYNQLLKMYERGSITKLDFFHHLDIINLSMLTFLKEHDDDIPEVRYIHNIFVKLVFVYHKKRAFKKGKNGKQQMPFATKLNIPKEFIHESTEADKE